jgi:hypothetical protein
MKYGIDQRSKQHNAMDMENQRAPLRMQESSSNLTMSKKKLGLVLFCFTSSGIIAGSILSSAGIASSQGLAPSSTETASTSSIVSPPLMSTGTVKAASSSSYCWSCKQGGDRESWWWGWGACQCSQGWGGACCDVPDVSIDDKWLNYLEDPPLEVRSEGSERSELFDANIYKNSNPPLVASLKG